MKITKETILKTLNSLSMPTWIKRIFNMIIEYTSDISNLIANKADLVDGKVPAEQLPSYVDDVIEFNSLQEPSTQISIIVGNNSYKNQIRFINGSSTSSNRVGSVDKYPNMFVNFGENTSEDDWTTFEPEEGKIYVNTSNNHSYRWGGNVFIDLDKNWNDSIVNINRVTKIIDIGTLTDKNDLTTSTGITQSIIAELYSTITNSVIAERLSTIKCSYNGSQYSFFIFDRNPKDRTFKILNDGYLQTYKANYNSPTYTFTKINQTLNYIFIDSTNLENNINAIENLENNVTHPCVIKTSSNQSLGYIYNNNDDIRIITLLERNIYLYQVNKTTGTVTLVRNCDILNIISKNDLNKYKNENLVNAELSNILAGNTVVLNYNNAGEILDDDTLNKLKVADKIIVLNDSTIYNSSASLYISASKSDSLLQFIKVSDAVNNESILIHSLQIIVSTGVWNIFEQNFKLPYSNYKEQGYTAKTAGEVNASLGNWLNVNVEVITDTDLNVVLSGDKLNAIKAASCLLYVDSNNIVNIYNRSNCNETAITFDSFYLRGYFKRLTLYLIGSDINKLINADPISFDTIIYDNYINAGGTRTKQLMYKEFASQLHANTMVLPATKLGTILTNAENDEILECTTLIITNYNDAHYIFERGGINDDFVNFSLINTTTPGTIYVNRLYYNKATKTLSAFVTDVIDNYSYYTANSGGNNPISKEDYNNIQSYLFNNTVIIDSSILGTTITDTKLKEDLEKASILVIKQDNTAPLVLEFSNYENAPYKVFSNVVDFNNEAIIVRKVIYNTSSGNLDGITKNTIKTPFALYKSNGGTKYTTEAAFNAQFIKVMDMTIAE